MTPEQLFANFRILGPQDERVLFTYLAENLYEATFADGRPLSRSDIMGFREWLLEIAGAAVVHISAGTRRELDATCPRCGHIHEGSSECGVRMGGDRFCRCEMEVVPA